MRRTTNAMNRALSAMAIVAAGAIASAQSPGGPAIPGRIALGGKAVVMVADLVYAFPEARSRVASVAGTDQGLGSFLQAVDPAFATKPVLDRAASAEAFAALKPDLVILKLAMKKTLGAQLEAIGMPLLYLALETPEDYKRDLAALGLALGSAARASVLSAYYDGVIGRVSAGAAPAGSRAPRVLVMQADAAGSDSFSVPPKAWMQTRLVEMAGGIPVWTDANPGDGWGRVTFEQIAAWNPDTLVLIDYREKVDAVTAAIRGDPRYATLACVKNGSVYGFPQDYYSWDQPDTRWGLGLLWLAKTVRPESFRGVDMVKEAKAFYALFYGFDDAAFERAVRPRLKGDYAPGGK